MATAAAKRVLEASRRVLLQKEALLSGMERLGLEEAYRRPCQQVGAAIGSHVRHSLDHYDRLVNALLESRGKGPALVKYDVRERGGEVETDLSVGLGAVLECSLKMGELDPTWLDVDLDVEFCLEGVEETKHVFRSNGLRELWFVAHHSIHHQAMIKLIAESCPERELLQEAIPRGLGLAPSTVAHIDAKHTDPKAAAA